MSLQLSRRALLQGLGLLGAASLAPALAMRRASAAPAAIPKRILFFWTDAGTIRPMWAPRGVGAAPPSETAFELGPLHAPLAPYKKDLIFLDGLDMTSSDVDKTAFANAHVKGTGHSLTGANMSSPSLGGAISIDQHIAASINAGTPKTKFGSLELQLSPYIENIDKPCYVKSGEPLPMEADAREVYKRFYPSGPPTASEADKLALQQKSVLDFVHSDFAALAPKLGKLDRSKVEAHAGAVRDLETRLGLVTKACEPMDPSKLTPLGTNKYAPFNEAGVRPKNYPLWEDAHLHLIRTAFACDLTRVITLNLAEVPNELLGYSPGDFGTSDQHDLVHKVASSKDPLSSNPAAVGVLAKQHTLRAQQMAKILGLLAAIPEADGSTLLDHTVVLWCGQIAEGGHDLHQLPWVMAGSAGGYFKTGRYLKYDRPGDQGPAHNDLFVSLANAMGVEGTSFGNPAVCKGPLPRLRG